MLSRLYNFFYSNLHNVVISQILAKITYLIFILFYNIKRIITFKKIELYSYKKAHHIVSTIYEKQDSNYLIHNRPIEKHLDLTIIIPVYNVELFLTECIESVLNQETKFNYEIIMINDGSTDNSKIILDRYKNKESISIITQENKGLSAARNTGIDKSKGKFIMFVDSDDLIDSKIVEELLNEAYVNSRDIVACGYYNFDNKGKRKYIINTPIEYVKNKDTNAKLLDYPGFACCKIYKRELFNKIRFPLNYWFEDTIIKFIIFRTCNSFVYIPKALYKRRINETSITHIANTSIKAIDTYWIIEYLVDLSHSLNIKDDEIFYNLIVSQLSTILYQRTLHLDKEIRVALFVLSRNLIKQNRTEGKYYLPYKSRQAEKSFLQKNFSQWELASKYL